MQSPALPSNESQRLQALRDRSILDSLPEERFDRLTRLAQHIFGTAITLVSLVDADRQWFKSRQGLDASETGRDISFCGHAILGTDIFEISDARFDPRFTDNPLVIGPPHIRFYAGAPLSTREGYHIGTLCIIHDQPRQLTVAERQALRDLADCVEAEINQVLLVEQGRVLKQAQRLTEAIARAQSQFIRELDRSKAFDGLLMDILMLTESEYGCLSEVLRTSAGDPYLQSHAIASLPWDDATSTCCTANAPQDFKTLFDAVLSSGKPVIANDPGHDLCRGGLPEGCPARHALLGIPIHYGDEMVAMVGISNRPGGYDPCLVDVMQPLLATLGLLVVAARTRLQYRENQQALARFKGTLDLTLDCVFMLDAASLRFLYANEGAMRQVGYSRDELLAMHPYDIKPDISEVQFRALIAPLIAGERDTLTFETMHQHKNGKRIPVEVFLQYIAPAGEPAHFVNTVRDISKRRRVDQMKNEFISTVSHELRTPLTAIRGSLGLIAGGVVGELPEQARAMLNIASNNTERLLTLINDILDMQKIDAGKMLFRFENVALMPLLEKAIADMASYGDQYGVRFVITCRLLDDAHVYVDSNRLMQVLVNLISNAAKFSPRDSKVEIAAAYHDDGGVRISISDCGPGIAEEFQARIFQPFSQSDSSDSRAKGGTGLGLAITKGIVEGHGGQIGFVTRESIGTTFYIDLPEMSHTDESRCPVRGI